MLIASGAGALGCAGMKGNPGLVPRICNMLFYLVKHHAHVSRGELSGKRDGRRPWRQAWHAMSSPSPAVRCPLTTCAPRNPSPPLPVPPLRKDASIEVSASYLEIYNEKCRDLLRPDAGELRPRDHPKTGA